MTNNVKKRNIQNAAVLIMVTGVVQLLPVVITLLATGRNFWGGVFSILIILFILAGIGLCNFKQWSRSLSLTIVTLMALLFVYGIIFITLREGKIDLAPSFIILLFFIFNGVLAFYIWRKIDIATLRIFAEEKAIINRKSERAKLRKEAIGIIVFGLIWSCIGLPIGLIVLPIGDILSWNLPDKLFGKEGFGGLFGSVIKIPLSLIFMAISLIILLGGPFIFFKGLIQLFSGKRREDLPP